MVITAKIVSSPVENGKDRVLRCNFLQILGLWLVSVAAGACECEWQGPFSWLVDDADAVLAGTVVGGSGNSLDLQVERSLKSDQSESQVRIWGKYRNNCRADLARFTAGSRWVFVLRRIDEVPAGGFSPSTPSISYGRVGDYQLSRCGAYWLRLEGDRASGNITSVFDWEYEPEMTPVSLDLLQRFIEGDASYADIIGDSEEVTSGEVMMRRSKREMGMGSEWDH